MKTHVDVVVAGAGPVGLLTAIDLTLGGASVLVLERLTAPSTISKALRVGPLGIEAMQRRGMSAAIAAAEEKTFAVFQKPAEHDGATAYGTAEAPRYSGHFAGLIRIRRDAQSEPERSPAPIDQQAVEAILCERARALGIDVRRGSDISSFVQDADGVEVRWTSSEGESSIRCSYLVGCDGGRSSIRKLAGFDFPGTPPTMTMYNVLVEVDHPERLPRGFRHTSGGMFAYGIRPGRLILMDFSGPPEDRDSPVTREEIESVLRRVSGEDVRVQSIEEGRRWTDNTRLAATYRRGRVLLAGDAAHVHSPFGGQGLSLGLVDAANLGWKLASVIRGEMPETLLDTYTAERHPVAAEVLENTRAQAAIMRPDPQSAAMRALVAKLMELDDVNRLIGGMMTGLSVRYDLGGGAEDVGRLIGDRPLGKGTLYDLMQSGRGVLLDASREGWASRLVAANTDRVVCVGVESGPSMLIRPDACVAWCSEGGAMSGLGEAVRRWFGSPQASRRVA